MISSGVWVVVAILAVPSAAQRHEIKYQKHFLRLSAPPVLNNLRSKFCDIASISLVMIPIGAVLFVAGALDVFKRDVSSTYAFPMREIVIPLSVLSSKQLYLTAIDHKMGSNTATQIEGDAQLPWPVPRIRRNTSV